MNINRNWLKEASAKTLDEFREQMSLAREDDLSDWAEITIYCPECDLSYTEPVNMARLEQRAKERGLASLGYLTTCLQCHTEVRQVVSDPAWAKYAARGPMAPWKGIGQVGLGVLVAVGFGVYLQRRRNE